MLHKISASAGSGKTYTLTRLFLTLLTGASHAPCPAGACKVAPATAMPSIRQDRAYHLQEIMAATFTNKAAEEMKNRVVTTLKQAVLRPKNGIAQEKDTALYEKWLERIFRHYSLLNIRTIDSLLYMLVRLSALELGLPPDFTPGFDAKDHFIPAYESLMADLNAWQRGVASPALFLAEQPETLLESLNITCSYSILYGQKKGYAPRAYLQESLYALVDMLLTGENLPQTDTDSLHNQCRILHEDLQQATRIMMQSLIREDVEVKAFFGNYLGYLEELTTYTPPKGSAAMEKASLAECLPKKSQGKASASTMQEYANLCRAHDAKVAGLTLILHALQLQPLVPLAREIFARIMANLHNTGVLPSQCLPGLARQVLDGDCGVSDAMCRMGSRLRYLLLDEFQDTSIGQWQAILPLATECLGNGGGLTYVGDIKQAIYSWRGGDASLFDSALEEPDLRAIVPAPTRENLPCNWRSSPAVVHHNNAFFSLLCDDSVAHAVMEAMFSDNTPPEVVAEATRRVQAIFAHCTQQIPQGNEENNTSLSGKTALYTMQGTRDDLHAQVEGRLRRLLADLTTRWQYKDIALLVRSKDDAALCAAWLTDWRIPVITENSFRLAEHPLVAQMVAFLTFVDYPFNEGAFWSFVTGRDCFGAASGLSQETMDSWLATARLPRGKTLTPQKPLFMLFRNRFPDEWNRWIAPFLNKSGLMSAYDMLNETIRHYGLHTKTDDLPFLRRLLELAHLAETEGKSSIAAFLAFWDEARQGEKLLLPDTMDAVRIMTIHKAKGLEFPVVILPFQHGGVDRSRPVVVGEVHGQPLLTRSCVALPEVFYPAKITEMLERLNLLYVAWTRPVHELHAFITYPKISTHMSRGLKVLLEAFSNRHAALFTLVESEYGPEKTTGKQPQKQTVGQSDCPAKPNHTANGQATDNQLAEKAVIQVSAPDNCIPGSAKAPEQVSALGQENFLPMDWLPRLSIYRTKQEDLSLTPTQRGNFFHLCLENLFFGSATIETAVETAIVLAVRQFPIHVADNATLLREASEALLWFAGLPKARLWMEKGVREQSVMPAKDTMRRVDLLVDEGDVLRAVEYKTGRDTPENRHVYSRQVRQYMTLLQGISQGSGPGKPLCGTLVFLDARCCVEVTQ